MVLCILSDMGALGLSYPIFCLTKTMNVTVFHALAREVGQREMAVASRLAGAIHMT